MDGARRRIISIHAPREGSDAGHAGRAAAAGRISIHAPREGSDAADGAELGGRIISIHAPREGSDPNQLPLVVPRLEYFYPRSPRGERPARPPG